MLKSLIYLVISFFILFSCQDPMPLAVSSLPAEEEAFTQSLYDSARLLETRDIMASLNLVSQIQDRTNVWDDDIWKTKVFIQLGRLYFYSGLIDASSSYYLQALDLLQEQELITKNNIDVLIGLGTIKHVIGENTDALPYFFDAISLLDPKQEFYVMSMGSLYNNIGSVYIKLDQLEKADSVLNQGVDFLEATDPKNSNLKKLYNNLGRMHQSLKNYDQALLNYHQAKKLYESSNDFYGLSLNLIFTGSMHEEKNDFEMAINDYRRSFYISDSLGFTGVAYNSSDLLQVLYQKTGKPDSVIFFGERFEKLKNDLKVEEGSKKILTKEMEILYEKKKGDLTQKADSVGLGLNLLSVFIISLLILLVFYYLWFRKNKQITSLKVLNKKLAVEKLELENNNKAADLIKIESEVESNTISDLKRNEILLSLTQKLMDLRHQLPKNDVSSNDKLFKLIDKNLEDKLFEEFDVLFAKLDNQFFDRLIKEFPELSVQQLRLCGFIRLKLNNKEISAISGKTLSTLHVSKSRLRKMLSLSDSSQSLEDFLINL